MADSSAPALVPAAQLRIRDASPTERGCWGNPFHFYALIMLDNCHVTVCCISIIRTFAFANKESQRVFVTGKSKRIPSYSLQRAIRRLEFIHFALAIPKTSKREIRPAHPGEMLREEFMPGYDLNTTSMAKALGISRQTINEFLRERCAISPAMALRLSRLFGNSPEFWLNVQHSCDFWDSAQRYRKELSEIKPLNGA